MNPGWFLVLALLGAQRVHIGGAATPANGIVAPEVLTYTDPYYTREAREKKIEGTITVEGSFDAEGKMTVLRTVKGLGYGLDESAIAALRSWKFSAATRNTAPVATIAQIDIEQWTFMPAARDGKEIPVSVVIEVHFGLENR